MIEGIEDRRNKSWRCLAVMKEFQDEAMGDWEEVPPTPQKTRKKKEFTEETAKKYWEMRTADFAREKRASVTRNNRGG